MLNMMPGSGQHPPWSHRHRLGIGRLLLVSCGRVQPVVGININENADFDIGSGDFEGVVFTFQRPMRYS